MLNNLPGCVLRGVLDGCRTVGSYGDKTYTANQSAERLKGSTEVKPYMFISSQVEELLKCRNTVFTYASLKKIMNPY